MEGPASDAHLEKDAYGDSKASKFHFKSRSEKRSKRHRRDHDDEDDAEQYRTSKRHRSHEHGKSRSRHGESRRKREARGSERDHFFKRNGEYDNPENRYRESIYDGLDGDGTSSTNKDTDTAFLESLFDAMADDEGADYWQAVYGQPIHIYPNTKGGPDGKLERMSDEEYAEYVRTKMWEKSHQHILEERAARERARRKQKQQQRSLEEEAAKEEAEREAVRRQMEESLRRGEERKKAKEAEASWARYLQKWELLKTRPVAEDLANPARDMIPWPVLSAKANDVENKQIERFLKSAAAWRDDAAAVLKIERVRWHPDKMQQRFGQHIDPDTMKLVTAVFQVIDRLWTEQVGR